MAGSPSSEEQIGSRGGFAGRQRVQSLLNCGRKSNEAVRSVWGWSLGNLLLLVGLWSRRRQLFRKWWEIARADMPFFSTNTVVLIIVSLFFWWLSHLSDLADRSHLKYMWSSVRSCSPSCDVFQLRLMETTNEEEGCFRFIFFWVIFPSLWVGLGKGIYQEYYMVWSFSCEV